MKTSILTATRNRPAYLADAIQSVEAQTDGDWEHLVYDNGSTDPGVLEVLRATKARNPGRFFYAAPGGVEGRDRPAFYWNILLGLCRGEYVTILDDDNRKHPDFLEKMVAPLDRNPAIDAVTCGWVKIDAAGEPIGEECHSNLGTSLEALWRDNTIDANALVFRRSIIDKIGQFPSDLGTCEDWHFVIRLVKSCQVVHLLDSLLDYRVHSGMRSTRALALGVQGSWERIRRELFDGAKIV